MAYLQTQKQTIRPYYNRKAGTDVANWDWPEFPAQFAGNSLCLRFAPARQAVQARSNHSLTVVALTHHSHP